MFVKNHPLEKEKFETAQVLIKDTVLVKYRLERNRA